MKKITLLFLSSILLLGMVACGNNAKTSSSAPDSTEKVGDVPTDKTILANKKDATSQIRRDQLNADIRAREQRNNITGGDTNRASSDLASEVRSKLEANIPSSQLTVTAKDGAIIVSGTVQTQEQLNKINSLTKEIKGVKSVQVLVKIATATSSPKQ
ncbi:MAG: BON domain-containing protein [Aphanizomenon sp.]|jgi:hyperosmotically inducible protein|uniref:Transporter n=1 Tax=Aphanizomenon flos-aquae LD13 TaxID=1710894 RepID=A0A1B7VN52_APHFL|nr:BON domain-containing protein [Aphanizomenon flos-aquae Clear-A1]MBO1042719.1 BON domain-containing protein [Aphanizomenon flos-aquae UKL13-PB]MBO1062213.1 BON domain-containing protein [Aphanizomenon flos-aquae CP01]OBQ20782.1 MAG: transporter [Anabaena sp. WA113]OBQ21620.1 MAG: transporter [Aphanizomenon flos-aquae LD13]OBQ29704.1 MAG: transporter [Aphanizomenon flos-aquae MDT14a]QSV68026.1 MAG: BON domain-containing protein [Aphanizomenon flos-aquae DEX188]HCQ22247.1 transporter [Anaba